MWTETFDFNYCPQDLLALFKEEPYVFLLESSLFEASRGRYSMLGFDPFFIYEQKDQANLAELKRHFCRFRNAQRRSDFPLTSGMVGYLGYDYGPLKEGIALKSIDDLGLPDCVFGFYDCVLVVDHLSRKLTVAASGLPERLSRLKELRAKSRLEAVRKKMADLRIYPSIIFSEAASVELTGNFSKADYIEAVKKALHSIGEGDIYQVNLSQRFCLESREPVDSYELYRHLTRCSPSSFGGYFRARDFQIISSSPERFLRLHNGLVHTRPMKGTRPRGRNEQEDQKYFQEIQSSAKEQAELLMITDLERNDLGRVCDIGSVRVSELRAIEAYQTVYQATSTIEGKLGEDRDAFDLIEACFPGGSISGCPKIRSMQIIDQLEPTRRGIYTGSMGYIDFNGEMDFNILIRTLLAKDRRVYFQVGGGIVADSEPEAEYEETLLKAKAMTEALKEVLNKSSLPERPLFYT